MILYAFGLTVNTITSTSFIASANISNT